MTTAKTREKDANIRQVICYPAIESNKKTATELSVAAIAMRLTINHGRLLARPWLIILDSFNPDKQAGALANHEVTEIEWYSSA